MNKTEEGDNCTNVEERARAVRRKGEAGNLRRKEAGGKLKRSASSITDWPAFRVRDREGPGPPG